MQNIKHEERIKLLSKIAELEKSGKFDVDVNEDPPNIPLEPDEIDFLRDGAVEKFKSKLATSVGKTFLKKMIKSEQLIIKEIIGKENLKDIKNGAILTCNHFNPFDCFTIQAIFENQKEDKDKRLYKIIREGNYTNFPGFYGYLFRNCDTLPLSSNHQTMKKLYAAIETILNRGDCILIYPEQSLWLNYKKPKPLKDGAFRFAVKHNVPIIPMFITMKETNKLDEAEFPILEYYVHIEKPIYKNNNLSDKENMKLMKDKNYQIWKNIYEDFYQIPLEYSCDSKKLEDALKNG